MDLAVMTYTPEGFRYLLVYQDYYSKFIELFPLIEKTLCAIANILVSQIFTRYAVCEDLHSDHGKEFDGRLVHELCTMWSISKTRTCSFTPLV